MGMGHNGIDRVSMMMKGMEYENAAQPLTTNGIIARPSTTMGNRDKRGSTNIIGDDIYLSGTKASKRAMQTRYPIS